MNSTTRRVVQAVLYETIAVGFVGPAMAYSFDRPATSSLSLALLMSAVALGWSYLFNGLFERWEARQTRKGRSVLRRIVHAIGFEGGLVIALVPVMAWWLETSLLAAFMADLGVLAFFFMYSFAVTWGFDKLVGLPGSASQACDA